MLFSDLSSPAFPTNPYPFYVKLRQETGIKSLLPGLWVSGHYDVVEECLRDRRLGRAYADAIRTRYGAATASALIFKTIERMMLVLNPPEHTRLRALLMQAFSAQQRDAFRRMAEEAAHQLVDRFIDRREADLVEAFAMPMPAYVICSILGVPTTHATMFSEDSATIIQALEVAMMNKAQVEAGNAAVKRLTDYFLPLMRDRRRQPGNDLISRLTQAEDGNARLTEEDILANIILLFVGGYETTANLIGNSLVALARHPEQRDRLLADRSLIPAAARECLRYDPSVQMAGRIALEDVEVEGMTIRRGQTLLLCLGSASRDPARFPDPDAFLIDRPDSGRLIGFGGGIHYCLGARLATIELETALQVLHDRLPGMQLDLQGLRWRARDTVRGPERLGATW
jgi:cytochrome P450